MIDSKYELEQLPITDQFLKEKRLIQDRGELALITDGEVIRHITYFSLNPGPNYFRGGHYHKKKTENFYIISGKCKVLLKDVETQEIKELILNSGDKLTVMPLCAHKFFGIEYSQVIEYYEFPYDSEDDFLYKKIDL